MAFLSICLKIVLILFNMCKQIIILFLVTAAMYIIKKNVNGHIKIRPYVE